jgi:hypothetical protein
MHFIFDLYNQMKELFYELGSHFNSWERVFG